MKDDRSKELNILHVLVVGGTKTGKSTTVNTLLGENIAPVYEEEDSSTEEITAYKSPSLMLWDTPGFGENTEKDEKLSIEIKNLLLEKCEDKKDLIDIILVVGDASSRDMGTEYNLISKILLPNLNSHQKIVFALNQCDFAMKGKNWNNETNTPNETLKEFLCRKADSVHNRLKESTGISVQPICYSAEYNYNIDALLSSLQEISVDFPVRDTAPQFNPEDNLHDEVVHNQITDNVSLKKTKEEIVRELSQQVNIPLESITQEQKIDAVPQEENIPQPEPKINVHKEMDDIYEKIKSQILASSLNEEDRQVMLKKLNAARETELNIMIVGGTGVGKSSTINALFGDDVAEVGYGADPQTNKIEQFRLGKVVLWDTPGLGDSPDHDIFFSKQIIEMLHKKNTEGKSLIDVVFVVIDASVQDMGTTYKLINDILIPNLGDTKRILVALNQCDFAMKGKYWNHETNAPKEQLISYLESQVKAIQSRIKDSTGVETKPIYYSALYKYNIAKLFFYLLDSTPDEKRLIYLPNLNQDVKTWDNNDKQGNYHIEIQRTIDDSITSFFDCFDTLAKNLYSIVRSLLRTIFRK